jgi:hypothetical protein
VNRTLGRIALVGFFVSLLVHLLTFAGVDVSSRFPYVWSLHIGGLFLVWIPFVLLNRSGFGKQLKFGEMTSGVPTWASLIVAAVFAYMILNFILCDHLLGGGGADIVNGQYVLTSHGHILAHLTEREYHLDRAYELRMFSGGWLVVYLMPGLYLLFWQEPASIFEGGMKVT